MSTEGAEDKDGREARRISGHDVFRFVEEKGITGTCPICLTEHAFSVAVDTGPLDIETNLDLGAFPASQIWSSSVHEDDDGVLAFLLKCENCGYVLHLHAGTVERFLESEDDQIER